MFLKLTMHDSHIKSTNDSVLYLGEWCLSYDSTVEVGDKVLPYHWDDRNKLYIDYLKITKLSEKILIRLAGELNRIHRVTHTVRFYDIILGQWLHWFISIVYDRFESVRSSFNLYENLTIEIGNYSEGSFTPLNYNEFQQTAINDAYNLYIFSRIINKIVYKYPTNEVRLINPIYDTDKKYKFCIKNIFKRKAIIFRLGLLKIARNNFFFHATDFSNKDLKYLGKLSDLKLQRLPNIDYVDNLPNNYNIELRKNLKLGLGANLFERVLHDLIVEQIPKSFIENYKRISHLTSRLLPNKPKAIISGNINKSDLINFWTALNIEKETKLIYVQHGGHYGTGLWAEIERWEIKISDTYFSWGWGADQEGIVPIDSPKLSKTPKVRPQNNNEILLVMNALPRYSYHMYSCFIGSSGYSKYFENIKALIVSINEEIIEKMSFRLYPMDYSLNQKERLLKVNKHIKIVSPESSFYDNLEDSNLCISTYNATTFLETFSINYPTVLFWDAMQWELNSQANKFFEDLKNVGIFHDTPKSLKIFLEKHHGDYLKWWNSKPVQNAKNTFLSYYGKNSNDFIKNWANELVRLSK